MKKPYSIGLDIGTNSVGWAVVTEDYKVPSKKMKVLGNTDKKYVKKNLIGSLIFDAGQTAQERRTLRISRRRLDRRRNRLKYLQQIFKKEVEQIDPNFFYRLRDSALIPDDKNGSKHLVFGNEKDEKAYKKEFPSIYHLREKLASSPEKMDIRLVYLALAHIIKYRGHFLLEGTLDFSNITVKKSINSFFEEYKNIFVDASDLKFEEKVTVQDLEVVLIAKKPKSKVAEDFINLFSNERKNGRLHKFISLVMGLEVNVKTLFDLDRDFKIKIEDDNYEENLSELLAEIGDEYAEIFVRAEALFNSVLLSKILSGEQTNTKTPLSTSMVKRYKDHHDDLKELKEYIKQNFSNQHFRDMFEDESKEGYAGYINHSKLVTQEKFYEYTKKLLSGKKGARYFIEKIDTEDFLKKQRTFENGSIPNQLHLAELNAIIENQSVHYPWLAEEAEKIRAILTVRIPYYVGPLTTKEKSPFAWMVRKEEGEIRPWNLNEKVNLKASREEFMNRLTLSDSYLPEEDVLPRKSLIYEEFTVFNELTKLKYTVNDGFEKFDKELKERIFEDLFKSSTTRGKVTVKQLLNYLDKEHHLTITESDLKGLDKKFNATYETYHDLCKIKGLKELLDSNDYNDEFERIVRYLTIFDDRDTLNEILQEFKNFLDEKQIKELSRKKYKGWGRLSQKLLVGMRDKQSKKTILDYLREDYPLNRNLVQLIRDENLSFKETIEKAQEVEKGTYKDMVAELPGSPAIRKGVLQSLKIIEEIIKVMGYQPKNIVLEMARENMTTKEGKLKSKPRERQLKKLYENFDGESLFLKDKPNNTILQKGKVFLYYLQNGRDMYTGETLDRDSLSDYDIDHIIPRSFITDNSIDNKVLTKAKINRGKLDDVPSPQVVSRMRSDWLRQKNNGLISEVKFARLTKGKLTDKDKEGFLNRQLVETRQIIKHVARILDSITDEETQIISLKSQLTSRFRNTFGFYKVREINDLHHAKDAYLNAVVANSILKVNPRFSRALVYGQYYQFGKKYQDSSEKASIRKLFEEGMFNFLREEKVVNIETGEVLWDRNEVIKNVNKVLYHSQINIVKKTETQSGEFFNSLPLAKDGKVSKLIPRKKYLSDTKSYGGYSSPQKLYSVLVVYQGKKKIEKAIVGITLSQEKEFLNNQYQFLEGLGFTNILTTKILKKYSLFEFEDDHRRLLASDIELQKGNQLILPRKFETLLYHANHCDKMEHPESIQYLEAHRDTFTDLLEFILDFANKNIKKGTPAKKIRESYEEFKDSEIELVAKSFLSLLTFVKMGASSTFEFFNLKIMQDSLRYRSTSEVTSGILINQSITGLYETRTDLSRLGEEKWDGEQLS